VEGDALGVRPALPAHGRQLNASGAAGRRTPITYIMERYDVTALTPCLQSPSPAARVSRGSAVADRPEAVGGAT
jgi:hypothetical protein